MTSWKPEKLVGWVGFPAHFSVPPLTLSLSPGYGGEGTKSGPSARPGRHAPALKVAVCIRLSGPVAYRTPTLPLYVPPKRLQYHSRWPRHGPAVMPSEFDPALGASSPWESMSPWHRGV
jgi:hypothetical protein